MLERVVSFIVLGLFIFVPTVSDWRDTSLEVWYLQYAIWFLLIGLCYSIQRTARESPPRP